MESGQFPFLAYQTDWLRKLSFREEEMVQERFGEASCKLVAVSTCLSFAGVDTTVLECTENAASVTTARARVSMSEQDAVSLVS